MSPIAFGLRQHEQVVVALDELGVVGKALATIVGLLQLEALDHGAHGAVDDEDALVGGFLERRDAFAAGHAFTAFGCAAGSGLSPSRWQMA